MNQEITRTKDGSFTILNTEDGNTYHSIYGALNESLHIFIQEGLNFFTEHNHPAEITVLEMGFGTGLNAYLTAQWAEKNKVKVNYRSFEKFPLSPNLAESYGRLSEFTDLYTSVHHSVWNEWVTITPYFDLFKQHADLTAVSFQEMYDVVFYDAFAPTSQPELWTEELFRKINLCMNPHAVLVTYCSKGIVKRALKAAGFTVKKLAGPPGKREMVRAALSSDTTT